LELQQYDFLGGPLIDHGLGNGLVPFHGVFAFEIGLIKLLFRIFR
jgi:hypothetical protein